MAENKGIVQELKDDLRRTHFTLGNDQCDWQTDTMRRQVRLLTIPTACRSTFSLFTCPLLGVL